MLIKEMKYSYNDIAIVPAIKSNVEHRSECNPFTGQFNNSDLPIFTAPMSTVVNEQNFNLFEKTILYQFFQETLTLKHVLTTSDVENGLLLDFKSLKIYLLTMIGIWKYILM